MTVPKRHRVARQLQRDLYMRTPDNNARINTPNGFLHNYAPVPWSAGEQAAGRPGGWWLGEDQDWYTGGGWWQGSGFGLGPVVGSFGDIGPAGPGWGPRGRTYGSPLTEPSRHPNAGGSEGFGLPAVTRCQQVIVESVVETRWVWRDAAGEVVRTPLWVEDPMLMGGSPGPVAAVAPFGRRLSGHAFWSTVLADALLWGQGGFVFQEASDGSPLPGSLQLLNPFGFRQADSGLVELGVLTADPFATDFDGRFTLGGLPHRVAVVHGQAPNHDGWPQGVLLKHWLVFRIGAKLGRYIEDFYATGIPSGYLQVSTPNFGACIPDPDRPGEETTEQDLLKRQWMDAHGSGRRSVAVLNSMVSYTPISVNPVDADAARMAAEARLDIAHAFGLSAIWLDQGASGLTYQNDTGRRAELVQLTSAGWGRKLTEVLSSLMPFGTRCDVFWPSFISPSLETLSPSLVAQVQAGLMTGREARALAGLVPYTGPDPEYVDVTPAGGGQGGTDLP